MARLFPYLALLAALAFAVDAQAAPGRGARRTAAAGAGAGAKEKESDGAYRAQVGHLELFLPPDFSAVNGTYDVVFHFHGMSRAQEVNTTKAGLNAAVVSINLGVASDKYEQHFRDPHSFDALLATTHRLVVASKRVPGAKPGRVALSAWSAGFASVSAILKQESARSKVDAVLLADGLHAAYTNPKHHVVDERSLAKYARLSAEAMHGDKLFVLTHSSNPDVRLCERRTETVGTLLRLASVEKGPPPATAPRSMQPIYQVHRGDFYVTGFEGHGVHDHIDHIWAMGDTMFPLLASRWSRHPTSIRCVPISVGRLARKRARARARGRKGATAKRGRPMSLAWCSITNGSTSTTWRSTSWFSRME